MNNTKLLTTTTTTKNTLAGSPDTTPTRSWGANISPKPDLEASRAPESCPDGP